MYLVSSCLIGSNCRYKGTAATCEGLLKLFEEGKVIPVCPEVLGGLSIPRDPCEIVKSEGGQLRVMSKSGNDFTDQFINGARITLEICKNANINVAILQSRSPSCGLKQIYDGTFSKTLIEGNGVTADLLEKNGIKVLNENNFWKYL